MSEAMNKQRILGLVAVLLAVVAIVGYLSAQYLLPHATRVDTFFLADDSLQLLMIKTSISFVNMTIIIVLLIIYWKLYQQLHSKFTKGLIVVLLVFFLYAFTSNPLLQGVFGTQASGLGLFAIVPDLFTTFALMVLFYLSLE